MRLATPCLILSALAGTACSDSSPNPLEVESIPELSVVATSTGFVAIDLTSDVYTQSRPFAINAAGQIVGAGTLPDGELRPFLWEDGVLIDLGSFGAVITYATDINDRGQVVGGSITAQGNRRVFLWEDGVFTDLRIPGSWIRGPPSTNPGRSSWGA